jgi:hypothetical protein
LLHNRNCLIEIVFKKAKCKIFILQIGSNRCIDLQKNARCKNKKLQIAAADSRVDSKIFKMQFSRKIYSADIILQIAAQILSQKVFDIKISTPAIGRYNRECKFAFCEKMRMQCDKFAFASHSHCDYGNSSHSHRKNIGRIFAFAKCEFVRNFQKDFPKFQPWIR